MLNFSKDLKEKQEISDEVYDKLYPTDSKPGILYGLCKIQIRIVDEVPLFRPILSTIGIPTYKLAKCFCTIIRTNNVQPVLKIHFRFVKNLNTLIRI